MAHGAATLLRQLTFDRKPRIIAVKQVVAADDRGIAPNVPSAVPTLGSSQGLFDDLETRVAQVEDLALVG